MNKKDLIIDISLLVVTILLLILGLESAIWSIKSNSYKNEKNIHKYFEIEYKEYEDFTYYIYDKKAYLTGLTSQGKEKEILYMPEEIDSYPVVSLGGVYYKNNTYEGKFESTNLKVFVITKPIVRIPETIFSGCNNLEKILYNSEFSLYKSLDTYKQVKVNNKIINIYGVNFENTEVFKKANIKYLVDNKLYFIDYEDNDKINVKPITPIKEGYEFVGWYVNDKLYDFETTVNTPLVLEAKWKTK